MFLECIFLKIIPFLVFAVGYTRSFKVRTRLLLGETWVTVAIITLYISTWARNYWWLGGEKLPVPPIYFLSSLAAMGVILPDSNIFELS